MTPKKFRSCVSGQKNHVGLRSTSTEGNFVVITSYLEMSKPAVQLAILNEFDVQNLIALLHHFLDGIFDYVFVTWGR
jgi:hypothetical protein